MHSIWFDFGDGPERFDFATESEVAAFLQGVAAAAQGFGIDDYRQFDTEAEVQEYLQAS